MAVLTRTVTDSLSLGTLLFPDDLLYPDDSLYPNNPAPGDSEFTQSLAIVRSSVDALGVLDSRSAGTAKIVFDATALVDSKTTTLGHQVGDLLGLGDAIGGRSDFAGTIAIVSNLPATAFSIPLALASWTAENTQGFVGTFNLFGSLSLPQTPVPFPSPGNWYAAATSDVPVSATSIPVQPLEVNMPTGAVLYFPTGVVVLTAAANPRDTTLYVRPVGNYITSGHTGTGYGTPPAAPGPGEPPAARVKDAWDGFRPLRRTSLRYPKPVLDANGLPT